MFIPVGTVTDALLAIENTATRRSALSPEGTVTDGAVRFLELALPWPLFTSIGVAVLTPVYAAIPPAASLPAVNVHV